MDLSIKNIFELGVKNDKEGYGEFWVFGPEFWILGKI